MSFLGGKTVVLPAAVFGAAEHVAVVAQRLQLELPHVAPALRHPRLNWLLRLASSARERACASVGVGDEEGDEEGDAADAGERRRRQLLVAALMHAFAAGGCEHALLQADSLCLQVAPAPAPRPAASCYELEWEAAVAAGR